MTKYIFVFGCTYLASLVAYLVISTLIDVSGSANIGLLLVAAVVTSTGFVRSEGRAPTPAEKRALAWGSFLVAVVVSSVLVAAFLVVSPDGQAIIAQVRQVSVTIWLIALTVVTAIYVALLYVCYGWMARKYAEHRNGG